MIQNRLGHTFPIIGKLLGAGFCLFGFVLIGNGAPPGVESSFLGMTTLIACLMLAGSYLLFTTEGIQIDTYKKLYRRYSNFLSFKNGKWQSYSNYKSITLLTKRNKFNLNSPGNSTAHIDITFELYLLDEKHLQKLIVGSYSDLDIAKENLTKLSNEIGLPIRKYAPQIKNKRR
jgi:hypothetical protein